MNETLVLIGVALTAVILGVLVVLAGIGLAILPPAIPIFGTAAATVSPLYLVTGLGLIIIGIAVMIFILTEILDGGGSGGWGRGR
ncbi:hypothetical protein [Halorarum halobium]|uniref:hypothetical protein n=1 Tax=Halorarum halobium TaxID=3075121 RepID=UPI0028AB57BB|nr:hypothetical protein [Halobaculum sp. XH14]